jgi:PAS domain S-box-containing protein
MDVFKLTQIIDNINEAIIAVNENAYIVLFNKAAEKLVDISIEDVIGKPIDSIIPNTRLPIILSHPKKLSPCWPSQIIPAFRP